MKRLVASKKRASNEGTLQSPDFFNAACNTVNLLNGLGYGWEDIKTRLIDVYPPYTYAHPDLEVIQTIMGIQEGRDLK
jgi:hypothetical protein